MFWVFSSFGLSDSFKIAVFFSGNYTLSKVFLSNFGLVGNNGFSVNFEHLPKFGFLGNLGFRTFT